MAEGGRFRNRNEREFSGYRNALDELLRMEPEPLTVPLVLHLHRRIFEPVAARETPFMLAELIDRYREARRDELAHPLVLVAALILDLLAIHPVADGNGRLARLVTTRELLDRGYGVVRYVSIEQQVFETKHAYYTALLESQRGWHEAEHSIWPWAEYLVGALGASYERFEDRVAEERASRGTGKQERVRNFVLSESAQSFAIADVRRALPGVSDQTIRLVLRELRDEGRIRPTGRGRGAGWLRG